MGKAYFIMPYGGKDNEAKQREFRRVYKYLMCEAAEACGLEVIPRQDLGGEGGHIMANVIRNLAESDIVIADISERNWNVAYELGIRHTMNKSGTVIICNDETVRPYDVEHLNIVIYPKNDWLDAAEEITERIAKAIRSCLERDGSDSPVHDVFTALPPSMPKALSSSNDAEQKRIMELEEQKKALAEENERLAEEKAALEQRLNDAGLDGDAGTKKIRDQKADFLQYVKARIYNSDEAVARLRELADNKDYEGFAEFLADVLSKGYLDETDCKNIYVICRRVGVPQLTRQYLETVVGIYPDNEELLGFLANEYSKDYHNRDRAITMANDMIGLHRSGGRYELSKMLCSDRMLGSFFDVYLHTQKYTEMIEIGKLLLERYPRRRAIINRNIANALLYLERFDEAKPVIEDMIEADPANDISYYTLFRYHRAVGEMEEAYAALECAMCCDPDDDDYYFLLAGFIMDEGYARTGDGVCRIDAGEKKGYAAPFVFRAVIRDGNTADRAVQFFKRNGMQNEIMLLLAAARSDGDLEAALDGVDFTQVDYCYTALYNN